MQHNTLEQPTTDKTSNIFDEKNGFFDEEVDSFEETNYLSNRQGYFIIQPPKKPELITKNMITFKIFDFL